MPALGLLFDVDGPLASPQTRTVPPAILYDLLTLARGGVPIAFITGRSDEFIRRQVVDPLTRIGLGSALDEGGAGMFGVFEKGAVWAEVTGGGLGEISIDDSVSLAAKSVETIRALVDERFSDTMFFDDTKRAMISVEQRTDVEHSAYLDAQSRFNDAAFQLLGAQGIGLAYGGRRAPNAAGETPFRVDPTIISTDIESITLDKDRGARRALDYFRTLGELPERWRTVGDSRSDYKMADELHDSGFEVAHVDVRPSDGVLDKPYEVIVSPTGLVHEAAGAEFLEHTLEELRLR